MAIFSSRLSGPQEVQPKGQVWKAAFSELRASAQTSWWVLAALDMSGWTCRPWVGPSII